MGVDWERGTATTLGVSWTWAVAVGEADGTVLLAAGRLSSVDGLGVGYAGIQARDHDEVSPIILFISRLT